MLSSVLNSEREIKANVQIFWTLVGLRNITSCYEAIEQIEPNPKNKIGKISG